MGEITIVPLLILGPKEMDCSVYVDLHFFSDSNPIPLNKSFTIDIPYPIEFSFLGKIRPIYKPNFKLFFSPYSSNTVPIEVRG